jgi:2'-5' RNA ligase
MIRLFVGLEIPAELRRRMAMLARGVDDARWVAEENLHISLRFIGEVPEDRAEDLAAALDTVRAPTFTITLSGAGHFESGRRVRVLWLGIERNEALKALYDKVESALVRAGLEPEGRKFKPHVTLARLKDARPASVKGWLAANTMFKAVPFTVDRFVLFSSRLGREGPTYTPEVVFPLRG